jgi:hypothetical protein
MRLVTAVDHAPAADVGNGVGDASRDRQHHDDGDCQDNATKTSVHGSPSSFVPRARDAAGFEGITL